MGDQNKCEVKDSLFEDIKLLIETIKYQQDKPELQEQALKTMASILHTHGNFCCIKQKSIAYSYNLK